MVFETRWARRLAALLLLLAALAACGAPASVADPTIPVPTRTPATAAAEPSPTARTLPTPQPTASPPPSPTPRPSPTAIPSATPEASPTPDGSTGLPCPATPPVKPDYAAWTLSSELWPTPDPAAPPPPLSLANPLPEAGRNAGYPYGSDGSGRYLLHNGLDMADEDDDLAVAAADGQVIVARDDIDELFGWRCDWYGQLVVLRLDETHAGQPVYVLYGHVKDVQVSEGQDVARGEPVAREGAAGVATVPHLHLEVRVGTNTFGGDAQPAPVVGTVVGQWGHRRAAGGPGRPCLAGRDGDAHRPPGRGVIPEHLELTSTTLTTSSGPIRPWAKTSSSARWPRAAMMCSCNCRGRSTGRQSRCATVS